MGILNIEFLFFLISIVANITLAYIVFLHAREDKSKYAFIGFVCAQVAWATTNYFSFRMTTMTSFLWLSRLTLFFAVIHTFALFLFIHTLSNPKVQSWISKIVILTTIVVALITLSSFTFTSVSGSTINEFTPITGPGMAVFGIFDVLLLVGSLFLLLRTFFSVDKEKKDQIRFVLVGLGLTVGMILVLILANFLVFGNLTLVHLGHLYTLPFVIFAAYAIVKHHLFNVKIIATETFVIVISVVYFIRIFASSSVSEQFIDGVILLSTVVFGILLVRSVMQEIKAREEIAGLAQKLTETNWELARTNEQLRVIDQRKSEFVSIVSHQLRTPITAVKGYTSLLLEDAYGPLTEKQKPQLEKIFISSERLAQMVNDFLDISKIEQGTMTYSLAATDVAQMLTELKEDFLPIATKKGLSLDFVLPEKGKVEAVVDAGKLRQIFSNLLDNAIKYTPKGSVVVTLEDDSSVREIVVRLKDSGVGLSQDDVHHLFGKFTRGSQGQKQNTEGSGLGLYVAKKMLEAMNGRVWVDSEGIGKGSTFVIALSREEKK